MAEARELVAPKDKVKQLSLNLGLAMTALAELEDYQSTFNASYAQTLAKVSFRYKTDTDLENSEHLENSERETRFKTKLMSYVDDQVLIRKLKLKKILNEAV